MAIFSHLYQFNLSDKQFRLWKTESNKFIDCKTEQRKHLKVTSSTVDSFTDLVAKLKRRELNQDVLQQAFKAYISEAKSCNSEVNYLIIRK